MFALGIEKPERRRLEGSHQILDLRVAGRACQELGAASRPEKPCLKESGC